MTTDDAPKKPFKGSSGGIMIVDDDEDDRFLFREALAEIAPSISCVEVRNGCEALDYLKSHIGNLPAVMFLDINMPIMNGWECLENLKKVERYLDIPVFVYSTSTHQRDIDRALQLGAFCFCSKVDDFDKLRDMLSIVVRNLNGDVAKALQNSRSHAICHFKAHA